MVVPQANLTPSRSILGGVNQMLALADHLGNRRYFNAYVPTHAPRPTHVAVGDPRSQQRVLAQECCKSLPHQRPPARAATQPRASNTTDFPVEPPQTGVFVGRP